MTSGYLSILFLARIFGPADIADALREGTCFGHAVEIEKHPAARAAFYRPLRKEQWGLKTNKTDPVTMSNLVSLSLQSLSMVLKMCGKYAVSNPPEDI
jgi:hypothetical protein